MKNKLIFFLSFLLINSNFIFAGNKNSNPVPFEKNIELTVDPFIQNIVSQVSGDSILSYLQQLEALGIKSPGNPELENTRDWLFNKYQAYGYTDIVYHDFNYSTHTLQNIVVTKTGTIQPDVTLIIDGHYDTIWGPGVNDNGSGVAVILEVARLLANIECAYTIKFINFSAEEQGLVGSTAYVNNVAVPQNMNILLVFNIDEVGGIAGQVNNTITCERDQGPPAGNNAASSAYTDTLATITQEYSSLNTQIAHAYGSDYMPFEDAGFVITGYYETNESPYPHSANDILANMDPAYVTEITKGAVAAALYFAKVRTVYLSLNHQPVTTSQDTINPYEVEVEVISSSAISSAKCYYSINSGVFNELNMSLSSTIVDTLIYTAAIPAQPFNSLIDYYFAFENMDSVQSRLPENVGTYYRFEISPDTIAPVISHNALDDRSYLINPFDFTVSVTDENGISDVFLYIKINAGIENEFAMTGQGNDNFFHQLTDSLTHGDSIYYRFKAMDNSANQNESWLPANGYYSFELLNSEYFSFENHDNLFSGTGDWQWGEFNDGSLPQPEGNRVWATNISANYSANATSELVTPIIDLTNKSDVKLVINHFFQIEPNNDGGNVKISTDSTNFQIIDPIAGYPFANLYLFNEPGYSGNSYYWIEDEFDLSAFSNQQIRLKFDFRSDVFTQQKGWYIDYVRQDFRGEITNHVPQIVYYSPQSLDTLQINSQQSFSIRAVDVDNDSLYYSLAHANQVVNDSVAVFTFTEYGPDTVIAKVHDGRGKQDVFQWIFYVKDPALTIHSEEQIAKHYYLYPPSPNPFNPETNISYEVKQPGNVEINVYNINGQKIKTIKNGFSDSGRFIAKLDGVQLSSGIYIIEMKVKNYHATQKAFLIK